MIVTIGGLAGSGTTTAAKILSKRMGIPYISAGNVFRQMAAENEMNILEFSKYAEGNLEIDQEIDRRQARIADESDDLIVEGRLSSYFVDADIRVFLIAPLSVRTERISNRENKPLKIVEEEILERGESEAKRYKELHGINIDDMDIYDLVIKTNSFHAEGIADIILTAIEVI